MSEEYDLKISRISLKSCEQRSIFNYDIYNVYNKKIYICGLFFICFDEPFILAWHMNLKFLEQGNCFNKFVFTWVFPGSAFVGIFISYNIYIKL